MFKAISFSRLNLDYAFKFIILLTLATAAPLFGLHSQWFTGPLVNMALILSVFILGFRGAVLIGLLPSTIALESGLLPAVLAPMIPFIIISNIILILVMDIFARVYFASSRDAGQSFKIIPLAQNYWLSLFLAAGAKYLFLFVTSGFVINLLIKQELAIQVSKLMSWPQFFTALIGGLLAWGALKFLKK